MLKASYLRLLSALYMSTFLIRTSFGIVIITFALYINVGDFAYGVVVAASPLLELFTVLFIGAMVDRYGRRELLLLGLFIGAVSLYLIATTTNPFALFFINAFHGIAAGTILVSSLTLIADYAPPKSRGREMGGFDAINLLGWIVGFVIGFVMKEVFISNLNYTFIIAGSLALFGFAYSYLNVTEPKKKEFVSERLGFNNIVPVLKQKSVMLLTLPWFVVFIMIGAVMAFLPRATHTGGEFQISGYTMALYVIAGGIGLILTQIFYGKLSDRYGRMPILFIGAIGFVGLMCTVGLGYFTADTEDTVSIKNNIIGLWPLLGIFGLMALAFGPSSLASLADEADKKRRGVTMGVYSLVISAGIIIGPPVVGYLKERFGGAGVLVFLIICAIFMLVFVLLRYFEVKKKKIGRQ